MLVSGNIITLYALAMGASPSFVGLLNAFGFITFFFMPIGRRLTRHRSLMKVFASAWLTRYLLMLPILLAPVAAATGLYSLALGLTLFAVIGFQVSRGIGMVGNNPLLDILATGQDRGGFITYVQIINSAVSMATGLLTAFILRSAPGLRIYGSLLAAGIAVGLASSFMLFRLPGPAKTAETEASALKATARRVLADSSLRIFILALFFVAFISSTARTFAVVYTRSVYGLDDGTVALVTVFGSLGSLAMGFLTRLWVDKVGSKPLFMIYTAAAALSMVPALVSPSIASSALAVLYLSAFHFALNFGFSGTEGVAQTYFFGLVKSDEMLDLGIVYYTVYGIAGASGSLIGGLVLDLLTENGVSGAMAYRLFFGFLTAGLVIVLLIQRRLVRLGALSLRGAIGVMFSFRDLRALTLVSRLGKSRSPNEEAALLTALQEAPSSMAVKGLLDALRSPLLFLRLEALRALEALPTLTADAVEALLRDLEQNRYTTAYVAARALGKHAVTKAVPALRQALDSDDYMLKGEAMLALARLGDDQSVTMIETTVSLSTNPRLRIMGVAALKTLGLRSSIGVLLDALRRDDPPPYLRDEIILALADIIDIGPRFYPVFATYLSDPDLESVLALDELEANRPIKNGKTLSREEGGAAFDRLKSAIALLIEKGDGAAFSRWVYSLKSGEKDLIPNLLAEAALEDDLIQYGRFRLLLACWAAYQIKRAEAGA